MSSTRTRPTSHSGGTWELVAKSSQPRHVWHLGHYARSSATSTTTPSIEGPRGTVNGSNTAGFQLLGNTFHPANPPTPAYHELIVGQLPAYSAAIRQRRKQFYGVGTLTNGAPNYPGKPVGSNSIGPAFTSLTSPQDIPWATGDAFGDAAWTTAARMLSGTFAAGVTPAFFAGSIGNVFTSVPGTNTAFGNEVARLDDHHDRAHELRRELGRLQSRRHRRRGRLRRLAQNTGQRRGSSRLRRRWQRRRHREHARLHTCGARISAIRLAPAQVEVCPLAAFPSQRAASCLTIGALLAIAPRRGRFQQPVNN